MGVGKKGEPGGPAVDRPSECCMLNAVECMPPLQTPSQPAVHDFPHELKCAHPKVGSHTVWNQPSLPSVRS